MRPLFWCSLVAILFLSLMPSGDGEMYFPHQDKVAHCLAYIYLYSTGWFAFSSHHKRHSWWLNKKLVVGLMLFGIVVELLQGLTGYRSRELADLLANFSGVLLGMGFIHLSTPWIMSQVVCQGDKVDRNI